ncbi:MAG: hypothetical protein EOM18_16070, partial [Clostridia bacterium]|nr:hypothetical protein [Clostridia bacterium]
AFARFADERLAIADLDRHASPVVANFQGHRRGGIVQGMSGSPILQDGSLIGAVTHVFVNDPARGYGIFAETMLENMK